jgi:hypothetical protein
VICCFGSPSDALDSDSEEDDEVTAPVTAVINDFVIDHSLEQHMEQYRVRFPHDLFFGPFLQNKMKTFQSQNKIQ